MAILFGNPWLVRVLESGFERVVSNIMFRTEDLGRVIDRVTRRFGWPGDPIFANLIDFSSSMIEAGSLLNQNRGSFRVPREAMPLNPYLFGDEPGGRREFWRVTVTIPDSDFAWDVNIITPDAPSWDEMFHEVDIQIGTIVTKYPQYFQFLVNRPAAIGDMVVQWGEARF